MVKLASNLPYNKINKTKTPNSIFTMKKTLWFVGTLLVSTQLMSAQEVSTIETEKNKAIEKIQEISTEKTEVNTALEKAKESTQTVVGEQEKLQAKEEEIRLKNQQDLLNAEQKNQEKLVKDLEQKELQAIKDQKALEKAQKKLEKEQKLEIKKQDKLAKSTRKLQKTKSKLYKQEDRLRTETDKFEKNLRKGSLTPLKELKGKAEILKLKTKVQTLKLDVERMELEMRTI